MKEEVALPPKYAVPKTEKLVVDAPPLKRLKPLQVLVSMRSVVEAELPLLDVRHTPLIAKHPPERLKPTLEVEVARPLITKPETVVVPKPVPETASADDDALVTASKILPVVLPQTESLL